MRDEIRLDLGPHAKMIDNRVRARDSPIHPLLLSPEKMGSGWLDRKIEMVNAMLDVDQLCSRRELSS